MGALPIREIRANGLMIGVEFEGCPYGTAGRLSKAALKRNVLLLTCSKYEVIRIIPALARAPAGIRDPGSARRCETTGIGRCRSSFLSDVPLPWTSFLLSI